LSNLSVRLPPDITRELDREAELCGKSRSDLVREAVGEYVVQKRRARLLAELKQEMRAAYGDAAFRKESLEIAADTAADGLAAIVADEVAAGLNPDEQWWK
jgi:metal-responsive CopG/Arc/MetJ family transcriptional regulator